MTDLLCVAPAKSRQSTLVFAAPNVENEYSATAAHPFVHHRVWNGPHRGGAAMDHCIGRAKRRSRSQAPRMALVEDDRAHLTATCATRYDEGSSVAEERDYGAGATPVSSTCRGVEQSGSSLGS